MSRDRFVLVMAASPQRAAIYARRTGLKAGRYRSVSSAGSIRGVQVADVHILPEFWRRYDCHAIMSVLRHGRDIVQYAVEMPEKPAADQGDGMGEQLLIPLDQVGRMPKIVGPGAGNRMPTITGPGAGIDAERIRATNIQPSTIPASAVVASAVSPSAPAESPTHVSADTPAEAAEEPKATKSRCKICGRMVTGPDDARHDELLHNVAAGIEPDEVF